MKNKETHEDFRVKPKDELKRDFVNNTSKWNMEDFEEPKQETELYCKNGLCDGKDECWYNGCQCQGERIKIPKEETKQETLEEVKDLNYWRNNAEEDYLKVPISVLRYISELEKQQDKNKYSDMKDKP
jgi:hypothetical protein